MTWPDWRDGPGSQSTSGEGHGHLGLSTELPDSTQAVRLKAPEIRGAPSSTGKTPRAAATPPVASFFSRATGALQATRRLAILSTASIRDSSWNGLLRNPAPTDPR